MKYVLFLLLLICNAAFAQPDTTQKIVENRKNSAVQQNKPYVILISVDGFRYDYAEMHHAANLLNFASGGVQAEYMNPAFPSLTFPNHYTLVTGMYPAHHGLVGNSFYNRELESVYTMGNKNIVRDGRYYGGVPLWVLAEQQKMLSASFYWVGSEAAILNTRPTYYYAYNEAIPIDKRIQSVVDWLRLPEEKRPHFITFYFPEVDHAGHDYGPNSVEVRNAVMWVDSAIAKLAKAVDALGLPVNYIVVSDHGMTQVDQNNTISINFDTGRFVFIISQQVINLYAKNSKYIQPYYKELKAQAKDYEVYLKNEVPPLLHYGEKDDVHKRIGDIVLISKWPQIFSGNRKPKPGSHGYDPLQVKDMRAIFYAWGPAFKNKKVGGINNVDVYPVITKILGLKYSHTIDGNEKLSKDILN